MSDATAAFKVVFHNEPATDSDRHVQVVDANPDPYTHRFESDNWDGGESMLLRPSGHGDVRSEDGNPVPTIAQVLDNIRAKPQLALLNLSVVGNLQDTIVLWGAWKSAMIETIGSIYEDRCLLVLTQRVDLDEEPVRQRLRETRLQLQTTMGTWREHLKYLNDQKAQLAAGMAQREAETAASATALEAKCQQMVAYNTVGANRCAAASRILVNAARALEATLDERRTLAQQRAKDDRTTHVDTLRSLTGALGHFVRSFSADLDAVKLQAAQARATVDMSIRKKQTDWSGICNTLQERFKTAVHEPLRQLMADMGHHSPLDLASQALDNHNDPHCIRRCEVALMELLGIRTYLARLTGVDGSNSAGELIPAPRDNDEVWDDEKLREARVERTHQARDAQHDHEQRMAALHAERENKDLALQRAKRHMTRLREAAEQLREQVNAHWQRYQHAVTHDGGQPSEATRRAAAITRMAQERQVHLQEEMYKTQELVDRTAEKLAMLRHRVSAQDRYMQVNALLSAANTVYDVCRRMRSQFEMAIHSEEMMRRIVQDQFTESARSLHGLTVSIVHKTVDTARSQFGRTLVHLNKIQDRIHETSRRVETLNKARVEQELMENQDIGAYTVAVYTALEEHVAMTNHLHQMRDAYVRTHEMALCCEAALALLHDVSNGLQGL